MRTVGVDLSAEPDKTAVATVEWSGGAAVVTELAETARVEGWIAMPTCGLDDLR
ncbi:hypothetical protein SAMN04488563_3783 [Jiangella alkaliphila]|uniref:Uncharacterized protein n=2 Tax=Jiangella alkaliphila TaxID=419479 RepID=A0A1H2KGH1_9ACTN|nr:hypothetical protein SAMN04488563_3783 [Jiangella alkaliphila]